MRLSSADGFSLMTAVSRELGVINLNCNLWAKLWSDSLKKVCGVFCCVFLRPTLCTHCPLSSPCSCRLNFPVSCWIVVKVVFDANVELVFVHKTHVFVKFFSSMYPWNCIIFCHLLLHAFWTHLNQMIRWTSVVFLFSIIGTVFELLSLNRQNSESIFVLSMLRLKLR